MTNNLQFVEMMACYGKKNKLKKEEIIFVIMKEDGTKYVEIINDSHEYWTTSFIDAMFFENRLKAEKFIRDKQLTNVQVCCVDINPYTI